MPDGISVRLAWLGALVLGACQPDVCWFGVYPPHLATDVRTGDVLTLRARTLPIDLPSLDGSVRLVDLESLEEVPLEFDADIASAQIWATPTEPLLEGHTYRFQGVDTSELPLQWDGDLRYTEPGVADYVIGGDPAIRYEVPQTDGTLQIAWSAPIDPATVPGTLRIDDGETSVVSVRLGSRDGRVMVIRTDRQISAPAQLTLEVLAGMRTVRGTDVPPVEQHVFGTVRDGAEPGAYDGMPICVF